MKIYLASNRQLQSLRRPKDEDKDIEDPAADLLIEDIIDAFQLAGTVAVNELDIARSKKEKGEAKYIYQIEITKVKV